MRISVHFRPRSTWRGQDLGFGRPGEGALLARAFLLFANKIGVGHKACC